MLALPRYLAAIVLSRLCASIFSLFNDEMTVKINTGKRCRPFSTNELESFPKNIENKLRCDRNFYTVTN